MVDELGTPPVNCIACARAHENQPDMVDRRPRLRQRRVIAQIDVSLTLTTPWLGQTSA